MSWLSSFLHPEKGYQAAQDQLEKYYQQAQQQYQPFIQQGQEAYGGLSEAMKALLDPQALQDKWASGYQESDAAKQLESMAQQQGLGAASSMGLMGSSPALQAIQSGTSGIVAQDRQRYLDDLLNKYQAGIGIGQNIYGTGATAANQFGQNAMNMGHNSAQTAFGAQNAPGDILSKLLQGGLSFGTPIGQAWGMKQLGVQQPWSFTGRA
jgi:hypothetical protein